MTLALYDHPVSSNALKARFLLAELGLGYERRRVELVRPRDPAYVALNPLGTVPLLVDGEFRLAESHAILKYLAIREGRDDLYPTEPHERARVDELLDRWATVLRPAFFAVERLALGHSPNGGFGSVPRDPAGAAEAERQVAPQIAIAEQLVGDGVAILNRFTIADVAMAPILFRTTKTGMSLAPYPKLAALRDAVTSRAAWADAEPVT